MTKLQRGLTVNREQIQYRLDAETAQRERNLLFG